MGCSHAGGSTGHTCRTTSTTTQISNQSWSAPTAHMCYPEQHVANFLQRLLFEFLRQGPLLLLVLIPHRTGVVALVSPILQGGHSLAIYCIYCIFLLLLLFLAASRFQELSEGDAKMGISPRILEIHMLQRDTWVLSHVGVFPPDSSQQSRVKPPCSF